MENTQIAPPPPPLPPFFPTAWTTEDFLGTFAKLIISFVMSVCVPMEQLGCHRTGIQEISYLRFFKNL